MKTVNKVDMPKFMGDWYVLAGRFTFLEKGVHNGLEKYSWNEKKQRIEIDFTYNRDSFDGDKKSIPQKGWVFNEETNAHWKVTPLRPFKFDYLVVALDDDYQWTAIGVPSQEYLWIMARDWRDPDKVIAEAKKKLTETGYNAEKLVRVPHRWP